MLSGGLIEALPVLTPNPFEFFGQASSSSIRLVESEDEFDTDPEVLLGLFHEPVFCDESFSLFEGGFRVEAEFEGSALAGQKAACREESL